MGGKQSAERSEPYGATPTQPPFLGNPPRVPCRRIPGGTPRREPREAVNLFASAAWRVGSNIGSSNRLSKSRTRYFPSLLCEVISDAIVPCVHLEVPNDGFFSASRTRPKHPPPVAHFSIQAEGRGSGGSFLRLPRYLRYSVTQVTITYLPCSHRLLLLPVGLGPKSLGSLIGNACAP